MQNQEVTLDKVIQQRLSNELGRVTGQLIEAQTYNEILMKQLDQAKEELASIKEGEQGEAPEDDVEVIDSEEGE